MLPVQLAESANQAAGGRDATILDSLAAAYAECGRYDEAVHAGQAALELVKAAGQADQARQLEARLRLYQAGQPYHQEQ